MRVRRKNTPAAEPEGVKCGVLTGGYSLALPPSMVMTLSA